MRGRERITKTMTRRKSNATTFNAKKRKADDNLYPNRESRKLKYTTLAMDQNTTSIAKRIRHFRNCGLHNRSYPHVSLSEWMALEVTGSQFVRTDSNQFINR